MSVEESWVLEALNNVVEGEEGEEEEKEETNGDAANGDVVGAMELETSDAKAGEGNGVVEVDEDDVAE